MTMFSMKPKFDLAEFLAVPAPVGARRRGATRRGMQFRPSLNQETTAKPAPDKEPAEAEEKK